MALGPNALLAGLLCLLVVRVATADPASVQTLADGLSTPVDVAVQPGEAAPLVPVVACQSQPYVLRWDANSQDLVPVVEQAPPQLPDAVPTALCFLNQNRLMVAWATAGSSPAGIGIYRWSSAGQAELINLALPEEISSPADMLAVRQLHLDAKYLYAVLQSGQQTQLLRARHNAGQLAPLRKLSTSTSAASTFVTSSPQGYVLQTQGAEIAFYDPAALDASPRLRLDTQLGNLLRIDYGRQPRPVQQQLYALTQDQRGSYSPGVYRLDSALDTRGRLACQPTLLYNVDRATAMAFSDQGVLYVVTAGAEPNTGQFIQITGEL